MLPINVLLHNLERQTCTISCVVLLLNNKQPRVSQSACVDYCTLFPVPQNKTVEIASAFG